MKIIVPIGLPASGKTTFGKKLHKENNTYIYDVDKDYKQNISLDEMLNKVSSLCDIISEDMYLDGLFLTKKTQDTIYNFFSNKGIEVQFIFFNTPKEICLKRDKHRTKERQAKITIMYAKIHKPTVFKDYLTFEFKVK